MQNAFGKFIRIRCGGDHCGRTVARLGFICGINIQRYRRVGIAQIPVFFVNTANGALRVRINQQQPAANRSDSAEKIFSLTL